MKVDLVDKMGSDLTVVNAARVSFAKKSNWDDIPLQKVMYSRPQMHDLLSILQNMITGVHLHTHHYSFISKHLYSLHDS